MTYTLECLVHFIDEQRTELYKSYCSGVAQVKNVLGAKNTFTRQALLDLERCGV
jgi:hypothetical protein